MNDERLINLETKFSFQEALIEELQQSIHNQYLVIERLEKTVKLLTDRILNSENSELIAHEKPPHY